MNEEQLERQWLRNNNRLRLGAIIIIIASILVVAYDYGCRRSAISNQVNKLVITGHQKLKKEEVVDLLGIKPGSSFEGLDLKTLEDRLEKHPRIKKASIARRSKEQLLISIMERSAKYVVNSNDNLYELDEDLKLISVDDVRDSSLCILSGDFNLSGQKASGKLKELADAVEAMFENYPQLKDRISEVNLGQDGEITIFVILPHRFKVFIGSKLESAQARKLYASLAYFENQKTEVKLLDLRGDDAVFH